MKINFENFRNYCLKKPEAIDSFPFDDNTIVFKVCNKIFALSDIEQLPFSVNLKCSPEIAIELREQYEQIVPGYHMNKKHWNTITPNNYFPEKLFWELIDLSYQLVVASLNKADKVRILNIVTNTL